MKTTAGLIRRAAAVLGVPEKTVRSRVMLLRKESLWSSVGKGKSPDPAPSDASNLLLSFLGGGLVTKTAETVRMIRSSRYIGFKLPDGTFKPLPPVSLYANFTLDHTLGEMLDALFEQWSERGALWSNLHDVPITNVFLSVERHALGWDVEFFLDDESSKWMVDYEFSRIMGRGLDGEQVRLAAQRAREEAGDLITSATIHSSTFSALAQCLPRATDKRAGSSYGARAATRSPVGRAR